MLLRGAHNAAPPRAGSEDPRQPSAVVSLRESVQAVFDPENLDASVEEVFRLMLGLDCRVDPAPVPAGHVEAMTAVVGFGGLLSGACVLYAVRDAALKIVSRMTGSICTAVDDTVKDAVGELGNMLAGAWKGKLPKLAAHCGLSIPAVITGCDYDLHVQAPEFQLHRAYRFDESRFSVTIICDRLQ
jgi:chemotaxis protein CheX